MYGSSEYNKIYNKSGYNYTSSEYNKMYNNSVGIIMPVVNIIKCTIKVWV